MGSDQNFNQKGAPHTREITVLSKIAVLKSSQSILNMLYENKLINFSKNISNALVSCFTGV